MSFTPPPFFVTCLHLHNYGGKVVPVFRDCQALHEAGAVLGVGCLCCLQKDVDRGHWRIAMLADIMDFTII